MNLHYTKGALETLSNLPAPIRKAFYKQSAFLLQNPHHPSLQVKKYNETEGKWRARVNRKWRFYFKIAGDSHVIEEIIPHPK